MAPLEGEDAFIRVLLWGLASERNWPADSTIGDVVSFCLQKAQKLKSPCICMNFSLVRLDVRLSRWQVLRLACRLARTTNRGRGVVACLPVIVLR